MKKLLLLFGIVSCWFTSSAQVTAPLNESFDAASLPTGWTLSATSGGPWSFGSSATNSVNCISAPDHTGNSGNYAWMDHSGSDAGVIIEMPDVDVTSLTTPYLEFYYWLCGVGYTPPNPLYIETYDGTSWSVLDSITQATNGWQYFGFDLSNSTYGANLVRVRFRTESGGSGSDFYGDPAIDDVSIDQAPACPIPTGVNPSNIASTSADLNWTAVTAATSGYDVIYGPKGFDPNSTGTTMSTTTTSYSITGLSGATEYDAYVVANCGTTNGYSDTAGPVSFLTLCVPFTAPYYSGFENDAQDAPPLCWEDYETNSGSFVEVEDFTGTSAPYAGAQALYLYSSSGTTSDSLLAFTPEFSDLTAGDKQIRFFANSDDPVSQLIVGTADTNAGSFTFTAMDTITFSQPDTYEEIIIPITTANGYNGTDKYVVLAHNMGATFDYIRIDEFNYEVIPPCTKVTQVKVPSATTNSFNLTFNSSNTNFDIEWGPTGFQQGTGCTANISSTSATLDNNTDPSCVSSLQPNTFYDVYVRSNCTAGGNGVSIWEGPITFKTACAAFTAPYSMDFENEAQDAPPVCWADYETNSASFVEVEDFTGTSSPYAGSQALYLYSSSAGSSDSLYAISPRFSDMSLGDKRVNMYANSDGPNSELIIGTADTNAGTINFNPLDTITFGAPDTYEQIVVDISAANGYNGTDDYIVMAHSLGSTFQYVRIDNFIYEDKPACVPPLISSLSVSTIGTNSADLNWGSGSQGVKTYVEVGATGFTPGTGTATVTDSVAGSVDTYSATGLAASSFYEFYIQDSCVTGKSNWIGPFAFQTLCGLSPATLPINDGFENYSGTTYTGSAQFCNPTYAWNFDGSGNADSRLRLTAGTGYYNTGTQAFTLDQSSFQSARITNYLIMTVDLSSYTTQPGIELGFSYMSHGQESDPDNRVWVRGDITDSWIEIFDLDANSSGNGIYDSVSNIDIVGPLTANGQTVGANTQIRFGQNGQTSSGSITFSDGYTFDDVNLEAVTCPTPSNLGLASILDTNAVLSWNANSSASGYEVWFGPQGFYQGTQTIGGVRNYPSTNSLSVDTLTGNSCYEYLVRYICGPGDTSSYAGPYQFCTPCSPFFAPYVEGFESMPTSQVPECFSAVLVGSNTQFSAAEVYSFGTPRTGSNHIRFYNYNNSLTMLVSPLFGDITAADKRVTMYARETAADGEELIIGTVNSQNPTLGDFNPLDTFTMSTTDQYLISNIEAANGYNGTDQFVALLHGNTGTFNTIYIDDFEYEAIPSCPEPLKGQTLFAGITTADLTFQPGGASNFDIAFGPTGFTPYDANSTVQSFTSNNATITGLTANTTYEWYVRDSCAAGDVSTWTGPYSFTTACNAFVAPFIADFESNTLGFYQGQDNCWTIENTVTKTSATSGYGWELRNTAQTSSGTTTGADRDNTLAPATGGQFFNVDGSYGSTGDSTMLISPIVDISNLNAPELEYHIHRYGTNLADFYVDIYDGTNWVNGVHSYTSLTGMQTAQSDPYTDTIIDLAPYAGTTNLRVRFRSVNNGCCASDNSFDDVRISDPIPGDLELINGEFISKELCRSTNDSILLQVVSAVDSIDFAVNALTGSYDVTGPINTSGTFNINTGGLAKDDTIDIYITNIDLSAPGTYMLEANLDSTAVNVFLNRDSISGVDIDIAEDFMVNPDSVTLATTTDSVEICVESAFFGGGDVLFTEISHFNATGAGVRPPYLSADDYIEISGNPGTDLEGITLVVYSGTNTTPVINYTFPANTVLSPAGTALIMHGQNATASDPTNFIYDGRGSYTGLFSSGTDVGYILKKGNDIMDAVAYDAFSFPPSSGVTANDWSGQVTGTSGTAGIRLTGADDNTSANWTVVSTSTPQDPAVFNAGVPAPKPDAAPGLLWTLNGVTVDTVSCITVGPGLAPGTYNYVASYSNACGSFSDTTVVFVPSCLAPSALTANAVGSNDVDVTWDSTGVGTTDFDIEYGPVGYTPGNGTMLTVTGNDSTRISGLTDNVCVDIYVRSNCGGTFGAWVGPVQACPQAVPCDDLEAYTTGLIDGKSSLFKGWYGTGAGATTISTAQASSGSQSMYIPGDGVSDMVAYFDTISGGVWNIKFDVFVPTGTNGYYNIQRNYTDGDPNQTNVWAFDVNLNSNGTATVDGGSYGGTNIASFNFTLGAWNTIEHILDFANDSVHIRVNGQMTSAKWQYSFGNLTVPLQANGVNFYSNPNLTNPDMYIDDFCVTPVAQQSCPDPTGLTVLGVGCDTARVGWSSAANAGSIIEYGPTGFTQGNGTTMYAGTAPYTISGLNSGTAYEFYVADTCNGGDTSAFVGPISFTTVADPTADFSFTLGTATAVDHPVNFDASASIGANSYAWDFGDGNSGSGVTPTNNYTANGSYVVTLTVTGQCATDTFVDTVLIEGIGLTESLIHHSLNLYPNPAGSDVYISFSTESEFATLSLWSVDGKQLREETYRSIQGEVSQRWDVSNLPEGVYMVRIESEQGMAIRRLIVE